MSRQNKRAADIGFAALSIEGGLIAPEQVVTIASATPDLKTAAEYGCPKGTTLREEITRYFRIAQAHWQSYARLEEPSVSQTAAFVKPLLEEAFGFSLTGPITHEREGRRFRIAWEAKAGRVPIVVAAPASGDKGKLGEGFSRAQPEFGDGPDGRIARRSPIVMLQDWLNAEDDSLWGIAFAGDRLRLMRDNASFTRPAFIEADLGAIFRDDMFADFTALWLLIHASRFGAEDAPASDCALERWREAGMRAGTTARNKLRENVEDALLALGQGFLDANPGLRQRLDEGAIAMPVFFEQLLRIVYRMIFLAVAEDRDLLHPPGTARAVKELYADNYGFAYLRDRSSRRSAHDHHQDAWEGVKIVFKALEHGEKVLGLPALGSLFARGLTPDLDGAQLPNRALLGAMFKLAWLLDSERRVRINWRDMATEELGSVYEGLLELLPTRENEGRTFTFAGGNEARGHARKVSSSYYTPDNLVQCLLDTALTPVLDQAEAESGAEGILDLNIIDPACGSGHFLLGAARRMATRVAQIRNPDAPDYNAAMRDVVRNCIHGVDRNPMAVELAKVALWIETVEPGKPLGFLDANIQCGDALLGVFDLKELEAGIPNDAYKVLASDDKETAKHFARRNAAEKAGQGMFDFGSGTGGLPPARLAAQMDDLRHLPEDTVIQVQEKRQRFAAWIRDPRRYATNVACDLFMAAFIMPKVGGVPTSAGSAMIPTTSHVRARLNGGNIYGPLEGAAVDIAANAKVFHWPLAFPEVIVGKGGFDVVLGNPPWDAMSPDAKEFFAVYDPDVRFMAPNDQEARYTELKQDVSIAQAWAKYQDDLYRAAHFMRKSGRFTLFAEGNLGKGDFNVYRMFTELAFKGVKSGGVAAQIIPEGFYNGANAAALRSHIYQKMHLHALITFENTRQVWFDIDSRQKFCLYAATRGGTTSEIPAAFKINSESKLAALDGTFPFKIPLSLIRELSPAALAVPEFADPRDVSIARKLQSRLPSFGADISRANLRDYMREIDMGNDRETFGEVTDGVPVFEGRMVDAFDYRAKAYVSGRGRQAVWDDLPFDSPNKAINPQWRISVSDIPDKLGRCWRDYRIGFCDVASPSNSRALVSAVIPPNVVCGHKVPTLSFEPYDDLLNLLWVGLANSFCVDFLARQKVALTMSYTILDSLPLPRQFGNTPVEFSIAGLAARLACAGPEMAGLWDRVASALKLQGGPTEDPSLRRKLRAQLDVYVARDFFGLTKSEMRYLLDPSSELGEDCGIETFGALKRAEIRADQRFTSYDMIMDAWDVPVQVAYDELATAVPDTRALADAYWEYAIRDEVDVRLLLAAIVKRMGTPRPIQEVTLAFLYAAQPHLLMPHLSADGQAEWRRLIGTLADLSGASVVSFASSHLARFTEAKGTLAANGAWRFDIASKTVDRGSAIDSITLPPSTEGRADFVWQAMRSINQQSATSTLPQEEQSFLVKAVAA